MEQTGLKTENTKTEAIKREKQAKKSGRYFVTSTSCPVCDELKFNLKASVEEKRGGRSLLDPARFSIHNWYTYAQTYSPEFVRYIIRKVGISPGDLIIDPFAGTGTTLVEAKINGINSIGMEAINFLEFVSRVKTEWDICTDELNLLTEEICETAKEEFFDDLHLLENLLQSRTPELEKTEAYLEVLKKGYVSIKPLAKLLALKRAIFELDCDKKIKELLILALAGIIRPVSNMKFGPEIGRKRKLIEDADVFRIFQNKVNTMIEDLRKVQALNLARCEVHIGDARNIETEVRKYFLFADYRENHIITSPPYPQDHDYTRSVRLELIILDFVKNKLDFRRMKERMIRSCTRNLYSTDHDRSYVEKFDEITTIAEKIDKRVKESGGTSGFEKLYSRVVLEYFGGMYRFLLGAYDILSDGGTLTLLVGDSHAFKMTHIETAKLLELLAFDIGFKRSEVEVWRYIKSTAHNFPIPENILTLYKK